MQSEEYDLNRAVLHYASACLEAGDWAVLRDLNFGEREVTALQGFTLGEITQLARQLNGHVLNIELDRDRFWLMLAEFEQARATAKLKTEMVCREAPADMMRQLFDMTDREYTLLRRRHRCPPAAGRPPEPDTETMDTIWQSWQRHGGDQTMSANEWLAMARETGIDLRTISRFVRRANVMGHTA